MYERRESSTNSRRNFNLVFSICKSEIKCKVMTERNESDFMNCTVNASV